MPDALVPLASPPTAHYYACRHDRRRRQVARHSLGTSDPEQAEILFHRYVAEHAELRDADPRGVTVAEVIERYWLQHGQRLAGADVSAARSATASRACRRPAVAELTPQRQQVFVERLRARGLADPYIKRTLGALRAAVAVPTSAASYLGPVYHHGRPRRFRPRERVLEIAELAALWRAVDSAALARWVMLLLGTGARPGALAELTAGQVDILRRRIDLHPPGAP